MPRVVFDRPIAHRGLHDAAAGVIENSRSAFEAAIVAGYAIECDLQLSSDGVPFVFHDDDFDRLTNATGLSNTRPIAEVQQLALKGSATRDVALFASTYLTPVFLGRIRDFNSLQIGTTVFVVGIGQFFSTIMAARLIGKVDRRILITAGLLGFSTSMWLTTQVTPEWGADQFLWPQIIRGLFIMLCIVPSVNMALTAFQGPELRYASGLFNLMRNLGGAIGIATVNTWLQDWTREHTAHFGDVLGRYGDEAQTVIGGLATRIGQLTPDSAHALLMAKNLFGVKVANEAFTMAFNDAFMVMAWMFLAALLMVPFCRK